jgi:4,5:9,10-diseco-3-hydroxy-5,9,17-trioxoandrosta-1(10),2-diene-4-oate hydrolase
MTHAAPGSSRLDGGYLTIGRYRVAYRRTGQKGPLVVALNAAQQTMAAWGSAMRHFPPRGLRLIVFDGPGQGRTERLEGPAATPFEEQIAIGRGLVEQLANGEPISLMGGSWGAVLAAGLAADLGDRVERLILGSLRSTANPMMQATLARGQKLVEEGRYSDIGPLFVEAFAMHLPENLQQGIIRQFGGITEDTAMQLYAQSFEILEGADIRRYVDLGRIAADTLIVNGALDPIIDVSDTAAIAQAIPRCRVRIEPGVGHFLQFEKPAILDVYARFFLGLGDDDPL